MVVDGGGPAVLEDAHADRREGVVQAHGQKAAAAVKDDGQVARPAGGHGRANRVRKEPGVAVAQRPLRLGGDAQRQSPGRGLGDVGQGCESF